MLLQILVLYQSYRESFFLFKTYKGKKFHNSKIKFMY